MVYQGSENTVRRFARGLGLLITVFVLLYSVNLLAESNVFTCKLDAKNSRGWIPSHLVISFDSGGQTAQIISGYKSNNIKVRRYKKYLKEVSLLIAMEGANGKTYETTHEITISSNVGINYIVKNSGAGDLITASGKCTKKLTDKPTNAPQGRLKGTDDFVCRRAVSMMSGKKGWHKRSHVFYKYVGEAKTRGISCGVVSISQTVCPENLGACSDNFVCRRGFSLIGGKKAWHERSHPLYTYTVEAKKRGLSCGIGSNSSTPAIETKVPKIVPVTPKKQPETAAKTASSLNDPLHIKVYGKTLHTLLLPNTLLFIGEIEDGDERGFRTALRAHEVDTVVLVSPGGLINEGLRIANIINDKNLATYVPVDATCASACSFMFFAGNPKVAHGRLGVHQFYVDDNETKAAIGKVQKGTQFLVADIIQNLTDFGTPASVFPPMFSTSGMYFFSETEKSAFSDRNKITPETVTRINEALSYLMKDIDNELDDVVLDGMPQKTKSTLIQLELIRIGCMEGPVDGIRGEETKSAIELLSSKMKSKLSPNKFSDLFKRLNNTKVGACY